MDVPARRYVKQLKEARSDETARADARRTLRSNHLINQLRDRQAEARDALRLRVLQRIRDPQSAVMEESLFETIRRTASWWNDICDHAVELKVHKERAERRKGWNRADFLRNLTSQERHDEENVFGTDTERWQTAKKVFLEREKERKAAAIQGVIAALLGNLNACVDFLDQYAIEDSKSSVLAQFGLSEVIQRAYLPPIDDMTTDKGSDLHSVTEAFKTFFKGCNPFRISTPYLPSFLLALLRKTQMEGFKAEATAAHSGGAASSPAGDASPTSRIDSTSVKLVFDVSCIPVFAVCGAKFSGKTVLTSCLVKEFGFVSFSDFDLVAKALRMYHLSKKEKEGGGSGEGSSEPSSPVAQRESARWGLVGEVVERCLLSGGAVPPAVLAELLVLQLQKLQGNPTVKGVVFDGVLNTIQAFQRAQETVMPGAADAPLQAFVSEWCGTPGDLSAGSGSGDGGSGGSGGGGCGGGSGGGSGGGNGDEPDDVATAWLPLPATPMEEQQPKKENKTRASKKPVDLSLLPPPVLPEVDDVSEEMNRERVFVEQATKELDSGYGGLMSAFFYIDCPPGEIFKRYAGLRRDKETGKEYHMTFQPPPEDHVASLVNVDRTEVHAVQLADLVFQQQQDWLVMRRWLHEHPSTSASLIVELNGTASVESLHAEASETVRRALKNFATGIELREAMRASQERIRELEATRQAQEAAREAERQRLVSIYTEKGVVPLPPSLLEPRGGAEAAAAGADAAKAEAAAADAATAAAGTPGSSPSLSPGASPVSVVAADASAASPSPSHPTSPMGAAGPSAATIALTLCKEIPRGIPEVVFPVMIALTGAYKTTYRKSWEHIASAANLLLGYRVASQSHIRRYWETTPDTKQAMLDRFVAQFNSIPRYLRSRNGCKDELHGIVDELRTALFNHVGVRKRECTALVESTTRRDAFLDSWDASMCSVGTLLTQVEAVRFTTIANLVLFYFSTLLGEPFPLDDIDVLDVQVAMTGDVNELLLAGLTPSAGAGTAPGSANATMPGTRSSTTSPVGTVGGGPGASSAANAGGKRAGPNAKKAGANVGGLHSATAGSSPSPVSAGTTGPSVGGGRVGAVEVGNGSERASQEAFSEAAQRVLAMIGGLVERLRTGVKAGGTTKAEKKAATAASGVSLTANPVKVNAILVKSLPIVESELAKTQERIGMVRDYMLELMHQGESYRQRIRMELHNEAVDILKAEASAVNSALYILRTRIEEERLAPHMHLGCGTFAVLREVEEEGLGSKKQPRPSTLVAVSRSRQQPSFLTDVPLYQSLAARGIQVHATLTAARLFQLVDIFKCVAPNHQLSRDDFILAVTEADYAGATADGKGKVKTSAQRTYASAGPSSPLEGTHSRKRSYEGTESSVSSPITRATVAAAAVDGLKTVADVFRDFDTSESGIIDWREFIVHLLFWCAPHPHPSMLNRQGNSVVGGKLLPITVAPGGHAFARTLPPGGCENSFYIPEVTIEQLLETKDVVGLEPIAENVFRELPFFFDEYLTKERRSVFIEAIWRTFSDAQTNTIDIYAFLFFLCNDAQPIRGAQKAFYVLFSAAQEGFGITCDEMERIFHTHATNPRNLGKYDPFSRRNQNILFKKGDCFPKSGSDSNERKPEEGEPGILTFQDMCSSLMGREMLNSLDIFRRKRFVFAELK